MANRIEALFPTPLGIFEVDSYDNKNFNKFFQKYENELIKNVGNKFSKETFILRKPEFKELENLLLNNVAQYMKSLFGDIQNVSLYITQSWLNITKGEGHHHLHNHSNSFLSCVFYYDENTKDEEITFHKMDNFFNLQLNPAISNLMNAERISIPVKYKNLVIFPSYLYHSVEKLENRNTRKSLAFNVYLKGQLGSSEGLNYLEL